MEELNALVNEGAVSNIDYNQLVANSGLLADLQASTAAALAAEVGSGVSASDSTVSVQQSDPGEVIVPCVISTSSGADASAVQATLASSTTVALSLIHI